MDDQDVIAATRRWIDSMVIGLNLCPFARRVFQDDKIRYVVSEATDQTTLLADLKNELQLLANTPLAQIETTLLIHPRAFADFLDYNDFLDPAERLIKKLFLRGVIQIASFHPAYQFDGTDPDDVENYTNRAPFPMLHLLREESIAAIDMPDRELLEIPKRNIQTLKDLGLDGIRARNQNA